MKHLLRSKGVSSVVLLSVLAIGGGCTDEETGFFIQGNVALSAPACVATAESSAEMIGTGLLDVALRLDYQASLLVGSQLTPRGDKANLRTETMTTTITGAEVQLFTDTGELDTEFTVPAFGTIYPNTSAEPGFGIISATLIPAASGQLLAEELDDRNRIITRVAQVKVFGETLGGLEIESSDIRYVIRVCEGCLIDFPSNALTLDTGGVLRCQGAATATAPEPPCRTGQDDAIDCRSCTSFNAFCNDPNF
jgi:hypothetical protein